MATFGTCLSKSDKGNHEKFTLKVKLWCRLLHVVTCKIFLIQCRYQNQWSLQYPLWIPKVNSKFLLWFESKHHFTQVAPHTSYGQSYWQIFKRFPSYLILDKQKKLRELLRPLSLYFLINCNLNNLRCFSFGFPIYISYETCTWGC